MSSSRNPDPRDVAVRELSVQVRRVLPTTEAEAYLGSVADRRARSLSDRERRLASERNEAWRVAGELRAEVKRLRRVLAAEAK